MPRSAQEEGRGAGEETADRRENGEGAKRERGLGS